MVVSCFILMLDSCVFRSLAIFCYDILTKTPFIIRPRHFSIGNGLTVPCFTAAIPSANVHSVCEGVHPIVGVFLDRLKQVGQIRSVLDLSQKLIKLGMFVCTRDVH